MLHNVNPLTHSFRLSISVMTHRLGGIFKLLMSAVHLGPKKRDMGARRLQRVSIFTSVILGPFIDICSNSSSYYKHSSCTHITITGGARQERGQQDTNSSSPGNILYGISNRYGESP